MGRYRHHKYEWTNPFGSVRHDWSFVTPTGAMNLHVTLVKDYSPSCGLEFHHTEVSGYRSDEAPDHINCPLTGGRCWHDGTSLYAIEHVWSFVQSYLHTGDHDLIFRYLETEADSHFGDYLARRKQMLEEST